MGVLRQVQLFHKKRWNPKTAQIGRQKMVWVLIQIKMIDNK